MRKKSSSKIYVVIGLMCLLLSITMGYALFSNSVGVEGTATSTGTYNLRFRSAVIKSSTGCNPITTISSDQNSLLVSIPDLERPGSNTTINVKVRNKGSIDAVLLSVDIVGSDDEDIIITYPVWETGVVLESKTNYVFPITIEWDENSKIIGKTVNFTVTLNYQQKV